MENDEQEIYEMDPPVQMRPEQPEQLEGVGQLLDMESAGEAAGRQIKEGMIRLRADFWAGVLTGVVIILGTRYLFHKEL